MARTRYAGLRLSWIVPASNSSVAILSMPVWNILWTMPLLLFPDAPYADVGTLLVLPRLRLTCLCQFPVSSPMCCRLLLLLTYSSLIYSARVRNSILPRVLPRELFFILVV